MMMFSEKASSDFPSRLCGRDLFMLYQATESLTNTPVTLGSDVNITCDLDIKEIYWYKLKLLDPPVLILRTYSRTYEGGLYYCVTKDAPPKYSDGTRLHITVPTPTPEIQNHTVVKNIEKNQTYWEIIIFISAFINGLLIIVII
ncbi:unnamed protein product, partial [Leuciscus chuanchicus]